MGSHPNDRKAVRRELLRQVLSLSERERHRLLRDIDAALARLDAPDVELHRHRKRGKR